MLCVASSIPTSPCCVRWNDHDTTMAVAWGAGAGMSLDDQYRESGLCALQGGEHFLASTETHKMLDCAGRCWKLWINGEPDFV